MCESLWEEASRARSPVAGQLGSDVTAASQSSSGPEAAREDTKLLEQRGMDSVWLLTHSPIPRWTSAAPFCHVPVGTPEKRHP